MKKIFLLFVHIAVSLHFMAQSVRPNRINLADQEAQAAPTTPSANGMVEGQISSEQIVRPKAKSSRVNLKDQNQNATQPVFIQGAVVDTPTQGTKKSKIKTQASTAEVVEELVVPPTTSKRPVRINLADQEAAVPESVSPQRASVYQPVRPLQKVKSQVVVPTIPVPEKVVTEAAPAVSKRPVRINLADQESVSSQTPSPQTGVVDQSIRLQQKVKNQVSAPIAPIAEKVTVQAAPVLSKRPVRINLADQEVVASQSAAIQSTAVDLPVRSPQKAKSQVVTPAAPVAEKVVTETAPAVSKRPVRINLADQEVTAPQQSTPQRSAVDLPARSIQKIKTPVSISVEPVVEKAAAETVPVVSKRPVRINLADQEAGTPQQSTPQRTTVDLPARSLQKVKTPVSTPLVPVAEKVASETAPVVSKRPVRVNLAEQETAAPQSSVIQKSTVDLPARSLQKAQTPVTTPSTPIVEQASSKTAPIVSKRPVRVNVPEKESLLPRPVVSSSKASVDDEVQKKSKQVVDSSTELPKAAQTRSTAPVTEAATRPSRVNLAEQKTTTTRPVVTPPLSAGVRPRTQVTSSKSLVDDTIAPLQVDPAAAQILKVEDKKVRVNLAEEQSPMVAPVVKTESKAADASIEKSIVSPTTSKKIVTQKVIKTINSRQYVVKTPVQVEDTKEPSSSTPQLVDEVVPITRPKSIKPDEKGTPVLIRKKTNGKSTRQSVPAPSSEVDGAQIAKLVESDAKPIEKARTIAAALDFKFGFNSKELISEESDKVMPLSEILKENMDINLRIIGHTDNVGSLKANYIMGNRRANVVRRLFEEQGVSDKQLTATSRAYLEPLAPNVSMKEMAMNRRVEVKVVKQVSTVAESAPAFTEKQLSKRSETVSPAVSDRTYKDFITTVEIEEGSRLTLISKKYYGARDFWVYIYEANKDVISNPDIVPKGTMIRVPKLPASLIDVNSPACIEKARVLHDLYVK